MNKEVTLPSGVILKITLSPFAVSKALYQAVLEEAKSLTIAATTEIDVNLFKDLFCAGFASKKIEVCLTECLKRATYDGKRFTDETFEPEAARQDYMQVLIEVALFNINPFVKHLSQQYARMLELVAASPKQ